MSEDVMSFDGYSFKALVEAIHEAEDFQAITKQRLAGLNAELTRRTAAAGTHLLLAAGKDTGSVSFEHEGVKLKADVRKTVKWDNDKLQDVAATLPWATVQTVFDIKFAVPERIYNALTDAELKAKIDAARTTKVEPITVKIAA